MANVYYKSGNQYKHLDYKYIDAAAAHHKHNTSDIAMLNFKNNGALGQNIFDTFDANNQNGLLYVPQNNSNKVYNKLLSNHMLSNNITPWYNSNKIFQQSISQNTETLINSDLYVLYEYKLIYNVKFINNSTIENSIIYHYPLIITPFSNDTNISISFKINNEDEGKISFNINNIAINEENSDIPKMFSDMGLYYNTNNQILGLCFAADKNIIQQITINNIKILTDTTITVSQKYEDYFDTSDVPMLEYTGSLGSLKNYTGVKTNDAVKSYYRSHKFYNLLTENQTVIIPPCIIPGFCDSSDYNYASFFLYWPYEIDDNINYNNIKLQGNIKIHIPGALLETRYSSLQQGTSISSTDNELNYQIISAMPGILNFCIYFRSNLSQNISLMCPVQLITDNSGLTINTNID